MWSGFYNISQCGPNDTLVHLFQGGENHDPGPLSSDIVLFRRSLITLRRNMSSHCRTLWPWRQRIPSKHRKPHPKLNNFITQNTKIPFTQVINVKNHKAYYKITLSIRLLPSCVPVCCKETIQVILHKLMYIHHCFVLRLLHEVYCIKQSV
jgi:hypothetical protein